MRSDTNPIPNDPGIGDGQATGHNPTELGVVPRILRVVGAGLLAASLSAFLFQHWHGQADIYRYLLLLAQTLVLTVTGLGVGRWLGEAKSARVFLGLSLIAVVVNFAVLGGLIVSVYQWGAALTDYPGYVHWQASSGAAALATTLVAVSILAPVAWIGYLTLARRAAGPLCTVFLLANLGLLVPLRGAGWGALMAAVMAAGALVATRRRLSRDAGLRTLEGLFASVMTFLPAAVVLGRGLYLYSGGSLLVVVAGGIGWLVLRETALSLPEHSRMRSAAEVMSLPIAAVTAMAVTWLAMEAGLEPGVWLLPAVALSFGGLVFELAARAGRYADGYRGVAATAMVGGVCGNLLLSSTVATAGVALLTGVGLVSYAAAAHRRGALRLGLIAIALGGGDLMRQAATAVDLGAWGWLAVVGTLTLLAAAVLERYGIARLWAHLRGAPE